MARLPESTLLTSKLRRPPPLPAASRSPTDSDLAQSLLERSEDSRRALSSSSGSSPSRDSLEKSPLSSRTTLDSSHPPFSLSKKPLKPTWSASSRTPTSAPSTPRELPSCPRTCNSLEESEVRDLEHLFLDLLIRATRYLYLIS